MIKVLSSITNQLFEDFKQFRFGNFPISIFVNGRNELIYFLLRNFSISSQTFESVRDEIEYFITFKGTTFISIILVKDSINGLPKLFVCWLPTHLIIFLYIIQNIQKTTQKMEIKQSPKTKLITQIRILKIETTELLQPNIFQLNLNFFKTLPYVESIFPHTFFSEICNDANYKNQMNKFFIIYLLRAAHIGSIIVISQKTIEDYSLAIPSTKHPTFYGLMAIIAMISGFIQTFALLPKPKGRKRKLWVGYHHFNFFMMFILWTPFGQLFFSEGSVVNVRFYWLLFVIMIKPYLRYFKEEVLYSKVEII